MHSCNLATIHVAVQHTADNISELLVKITDYWDITSKVHIMVQTVGLIGCLLCGKLAGSTFSVLHTPSI